MTRPRPPKGPITQRGSRGPAEPTSVEETEVMPATARARQRASEKAAAKAAGAGAGVPRAKRPILPKRVTPAAEAPQGSRRDRRARRKERKAFAPESTGPSATKLILAVALIVALDILLFFAIGFALGKVVL